MNFGIKLSYQLPTKVKASPKERVWLERLGRIGINIIKRQIDMAYALRKDKTDIEQLKTSFKVELSKNSILFLSSKDFIKETSWLPNESFLTTVGAYVGKIPKKLRGTTLIYNWAPNLAHTAIPGVKKVPVPGVGYRNQRFIKRGLTLAEKMVQRAVRPSVGYFDLRNFKIKI